MSLSAKQRVFTGNVGKLIVWAYANGYGLTFGECQRTMSQQILYYFGYKIIKTKRWFKLVKVSKKTRTFDSKHLKKLAIDLNVFINGRYTTDWHEIKPLGDFWVSLNPNNRWGGDFNKNNKKDGFVDSPHFEYNV